MPTYKFWCPVCNAEAEKLQPHSALAPYCSECENEGSQSYPVRMIRVASAPNFSVKGYAASNGYSKKS